MLKRISRLIIVGILIFSATSFAQNGDENGGPSLTLPEPQEVWNTETEQFEMKVETPFSLGDPTADLVFTPVTPCRVVDTRFGSSSFSGPISGGTTLNIDTDTSNMSFQGGSPTGCGVSTNAAAVVVTVTVVNASTNGHFRLFPYSTTMPTAAVLNYNTSYNTIGNTTIVPQNTSSSAAEISLYTHGTANIIVDVVGYFDPPEATVLDAVRLSSFRNLAPGATVSFNSPTCATGYVRVGGNCNPVSYDVVMGDSSITTGTPGNMHCNFKNNGSFSTNVYANVICAKVPGK